MIRVGFILSYTDSNWVGGINYLRNLLHSVAGIPDRRIEPVLFIPPATPPSLLAGFPDLPVVRTAVVDGTHRGWATARKLGERVVGNDFLVAKLLRDNGVRLVFHSGQLGRRANLPTIGWLPDFQHVRMPEFFEAAEIAARGRGYRRVADQCTTILLSSLDARSDLERFAPSAIAKSRVLHFVSGIASPAAPETEARLRDRYGITGPYFHLPNQFWAHKNHRVVIDALAFAKARGTVLHVVSTGQTVDRRNPQNFDDLMRHAADRNVLDCFRVLGLVPYEDLAGLMQHAVAVINPSLFEGWSTTVEEAKSLGLRIVLSDIPVHREQAPERGVFFDPRDPASLAAAMTAVQAQYDEAAEAAFRASAQSTLVARFCAFGEEYQDIVLETLERA